MHDSVELEEGKTVERRVELENGTIPIPLHTTDDALMGITSPSEPASPSPQRPERAVPSLTSPLVH